MRLILSYNKKWLIFALSFFILFTGILLVSEFYHERQIRSEALNEELNNYSGIIDRYIRNNDLYENGQMAGIDSLVSLIPRESLRVTVIEFNGRVVYDSEVGAVQGMENHINRPEVQDALNDQSGSDIRVSATTKKKYYYHASRFNQYIVRTSVIYDIDARQFLQPDRIFMIFIALILFVTAFTIVLITDKYGKSISTLRKFTLNALANQPLDEKMVFPKNELGLIGQDIIDIYQGMKKAKEDLQSEKAKLIRHLNLLDEGIAIFSHDLNVITNNNHFIQFINHISDKRVFSAGEFFKIQDFYPLFSFINKFTGENMITPEGDLPSYEITIHKGGKYFSVRSTIFHDRSFEISINDITKRAKRKLIKKQMTGNIAHELKTPVSSIRGFLETILINNPGKEKTRDFLQRAYSQSMRLAELIDDISLLTKIEEAASLYFIEEININELVTDILNETQPKLRESNISFELSLPENLIVKGNQVLLYSIFRNLVDNTIHHAGRDLIARLENYMQDSNHYYFSYSDSGIGVPNEDLPRLFERFYRVDKGRDRKKGGTGLGLAIVKNAVQFHRGDISAKNRNEGGLEFLFTLSKEMQLTPK
jgi:two-component system OmpR family sensor kinase/two-component system phosphate regulon sensor histidine kinase PhoR